MTFYAFLPKTHKNPKQTHKTPQHIMVLCSSYRKAFFSIKSYENSRKKAKGNLETPRKYGKTWENLSNCRSEDLLHASRNKRKTMPPQVWPHVSNISMCVPNMFTMLPQMFPGRRRSEISYPVPPRIDSKDPPHERKKVFGSRTN